MEIKHTQAFDLAYRFATETQLNIFLTGKAGTGKTTFLKYLRENTTKNMIVAAPTGIAAINAGGVTLHSFFQLPFSPFIPSKDLQGNVVSNHSFFSRVHYNKEKLNIMRNLELLVIDESSMVAAHTVDAIDTILRWVRKNNWTPFGGVQVLFIGDLHQLQPVVNKTDWEMLKKFYTSIFFFDSVVLKEHVPVMVELKEIFRQRDESFIEILNEIRHNNLTEKNFSLLNSRLRPGFVPNAEEGYITLTTHNTQADEINKRTLSNLPGKSNTFKAIIEGEFPESQFPAESELELKEGAQVMFLKNDTVSKQYFNGKIGMITSIDGDKIRVKCPGDKVEIDVTRQEWLNVNYTLDEASREIKEEEVGIFLQYPLRLAWALTIHKSQGLTFEKLIIDAENAFANGQVYVALSRCTSLEGLVLTSKVSGRFLGAHSDLKEWQEKNNDEESLPVKLNDSRKELSLSELMKVFSFEEWGTKLSELKNLLEENEKHLQAGWKEWIESLIKKHASIEEVSSKFKKRITDLTALNSDIEGNTQLQGRIKDAANYFSGAINEWNESFYSLPVKSKNKKAASLIDILLGEMNLLIHEQLFRINHCKEGFVLKNYLKEGKRPTGTLAKIQTVYSQPVTEKSSKKTIIQIPLYDAIVQWRNKIANSLMVPNYIIINNDTATNICLSLPGNEAALLAVKGIGKATVKKYGKELLELVQKYCDENNLEPIMMEETIKKKTNPTSTVDETVRLLKEGKSVPEIAEERKFTIDTISNHLSKAILLGLVDIEEVMPLDEINRIKEFIPPGEEKYFLSDIKAKAPPEISYGKIRVVLAWMEKEKGR